VRTIPRRTRGDVRRSRGQVTPRRLLVDPARAIVRRHVGSPRAPDWSRALPKSKPVRAATSLPGLSVGGNRRRNLAFPKARRVDDVVLGWLAPAVALHQEPLEV